MYEGAKLELCSKLTFYLNGSVLNSYIMFINIGTLACTYEYFSSWTYVLNMIVIEINLRLNMPLELMPIKKSVVY